MALGVDAERVDLDEDGILFLGEPDQALEHFDAFADLLGVEAAAEEELAGLEGPDFVGRVELAGEDVVGRLGRHGLDVHAAVRGGHAGKAAGRAVEHHGKVELAGYAGAALHPDLVDDFAGFARLLGDELHADDGLGGGLDFLDGLADLDAASLAAAAGVHLGLDDPGRLELAGGLDGLLGSEGEEALRNRDAVFGEKALGLVLMYVHDCSICC